VHLRCQLIGHFAAATFVTPPGVGEEILATLFLRHDCFEAPKCARVGHVTAEPVDFVPTNAKCKIVVRCRQSLAMALHRRGRGGPTGAKHCISHKSMRACIALHHVHVTALAILLLTRLTCAMEPVQLETILTRITLRRIARASLASGRSTGQARARARAHDVALLARIAPPWMCIAGRAAHRLAFL